MFDVHLQGGKKKAYWCRFWEEAEHCLQEQCFLSSIGIHIDLNFIEIEDVIVREEGVEFPFYNDMEGEF
jgi:hypothetical protein